MILDLNCIFEPIINILTIKHNDIDTSFIVNICLRLVPDGTETGPG